MEKIDSIVIETALQELKTDEIAQVRQEIVQELGTTAIGSDLVETNPLDELSTEIQQKPGTERAKFVDSETHRSPRFKRDRFKDEVAAAAKPKKHKTVLNKRLNNLASRQNTPKTSFAHLDLNN